MNFLHYLFIVLASGFASIAGAGDFSPSCTESFSKEIYRPGDAGFEEVIAKYNDLALKSHSAKLSPKGARPWMLNADETAYISISHETNSCAVVSEEPVASVKYSCDYAGCNESIGGTDSMPVGDRITRDSCNSSTSVRTTTTWVKQSDGTWTVTKHTEEVQTQGCPIS